MRRLDISPRRATPKGHKTFIYYTALLHEDLPTLRPPIRIRGTREDTDSPARRDRRPLWGSSIPRGQGAVPLLQRGGEPPSDIQQNPFLVGVPLDRLEH